MGRKKFAIADSIKYLFPSNWKITPNQFYTGELDGLEILGRVLCVYRFATLGLCSNFVAVSYFVHVTDLANQFSVQHLRICSLQGYCRSLGSSSSASSWLP